MRKLAWPIFGQVHLLQRKRIAVDAGTEMVAGKQSRQDCVDSVLRPAIGRSIELLPNLRASLSRAN